jgi:electron transfer flavoprotein alpha subunit
MRKILVLVEHTNGVTDDSAYELAAAARSLDEAGEGVRVGAVVLGDEVGALAEGLGAWFDDVYVFDSPRLQVPDGVAGAELLAGLIEREQPFATLIPHTNTGMDLAPVLAVKAGAPLFADCIALQATPGGLSGVRTRYGGKVHARISAAGDGGFMATIRPGSFAASEAPGAGGAVHVMDVPEGLAPRRRYVETISPEPGAVDISQAEVLVAVGRGIDEEEHLGIVRSLADAMGAEIACTRPVVDKGWLSKSYQIGTSGVSVKPKVYVAIGISGSYQHIGGIKGSPYIAAINKDPAAPIFAVADVGIVGDLFDIVPLLEKKIREVKGAG